MNSGKVAKRMIESDRKSLVGNLIFYKVSNQHSLLPLTVFLLNAIKDLLGENIQHNTRINRWGGWEGGTKINPSH